MMMKAFSKGITKAQMQAKNKQLEEMEAIWQSGKVTKVSCSIKSICNMKNITTSHSEHLLFEEHLGLPYWIAKLADSIVANLSIDDAKKWSGRFINAVVEGSDVSSIKNEFLARIIESTFNSYDNIKFKDLKNAQEMVIAGLREGDKNKIEKGRKAAYSATYALVPAGYGFVSSSDGAYDLAVAASAAAFASGNAADFDYGTASENSYLSTSNILIELLESCEGSEMINDRRTGIKAIDNCVNAINDGFFTNNVEQAQKIAERLYVKGMLA